MSEPTFPRRLLIGWIAGAILVFAISLYFMGRGEPGGEDSAGPSTFSRSAIGYQGIAEVLQQLAVPVVKSRSSSLEKLAPGSVLVIAEPQHTPQTEETIRALLKAPTILLVLPKWIGLPGGQKPGWLRQVAPAPLPDARWTLNLVAPRGEVARESGSISWTTNALQITPNVEAPIQLVRGERLRPIIGAAQGMLVGEISDRDHRIWVLADPDVLSNHGIARPDNAALAVAMVNKLGSRGGGVVFDETVHGFLVRTASPFRLMFRFPFVLATVQGVIAAMLLLWATLGRFGAAQVAPAPLSAGREGLLSNMAKLVEFTGHQDVMVRRYVQETIRDVASQLHAPRELAGAAQIAWLKRIALARGVRIDCEAVLLDAQAATAGRRNASLLVRLARDIHQWKGEIVDGRARHPRDH